MRIGSLCGMVSPLPINTMKTNTTARRPRLESVIREHLAGFPPSATFDVIAFELWGNRREGFDCNDAWKIARSVPAADVPTIARARWDVFKLNYLPAARVSDIEDASCGCGSEILLEVNCVPFLTILPIE